MDLQKEYKNKKHTLHLIPIPGMDAQLFHLERHMTQVWDTGNIGLETLQDVANALGYEKEIALEGDFLDVDKGFVDFMRVFLRINEFSQTDRVPLPGFQEMLKQGSIQPVQSIDELYASLDQFGEGVQQTVRDIFTPQTYDFAPEDRVIKTLVGQTLYIPGIGKEAFQYELQRKKELGDDIGREVLEDIAAAKEVTNPLKFSPDPTQFTDFMKYIIAIEQANQLPDEIAKYRGVIENVNAIHDQFGEQAYQTVCAIYQFTEEGLGKMAKCVALAEKHNLSPVLVTQSE